MRPDALRAHPGAAAGAALFAVMSVWSLLTPLFAGPDETSNTVKAAAVVRGELSGAGQPPSVQDAYFRTTVAIDPRFGNPNQIPWCFAPHPERPACNVSMADVPPLGGDPFTNVGRYPPVAFALPGLATFLGPTDTAVRVARLLNAAWTAALVGIGVGVARRRAVGTAPLLVAVTPMVLFLGSIVSPSGPEVASGLALWLLAIPLARGELSTRADRVGLWVVLLTLVTARPLGALLAALILALAWLADGTVSPLAAARRHTVTSLSVSVAVAFMAVWYVRVYAVNLGRSVVAGEPSIGTTRVLLHGVGHLTALLAEMVGNFGWLDTPAPSFAVTAWLAAVAALAVWSIARAPGRRRTSLVLVPAVVVALSLFLDRQYYLILRNFGVQGRHLLPIAFGVVLLGSERLYLRRAATIAAATAWAVVQWTCGLFALRRYAVGVRPDNFVDVIAAPVWRPRLGVVPTLVLLALALAGAAAALVATEPRPLAP